MVTEYLNALKTKGNYSWQDLSDMTGIPVPTIRKTISGNTVNPSFDVVSKLVTAMGGNISELEERKKTPVTRTEISDDDMQVTMAQIKLLYEARIADLWRMIDKLIFEKKTLFITMITLVSVLLILILYLFIDGMHGNWGFFQY